MSLHNIVNKAFGELRAKALPLSALVLTSGADHVFTQVGIHKFGIDYEFNPFLRNFVESYGVVQGHLLFETIAFPPFLILTYLSSKTLGSWSDNPGTKRFLECLPFYAFSTLNLYLIGLHIDHYL